MEKEKLILGLLAFVLPAAVALALPPGDPALSGPTRFSAGSAGTLDGSGATDQVAIWSDADTLAGDTGFTVNTTTNVFTAAGGLAVTSGNLAITAGDVALTAGSISMELKTTDVEPEWIKVPGIEAATVANKPTCASNADAGKMIYIDVAGDGNAGMLCYCRANSASVWAWTRVENITTACL